jgi:hypothetical protein
MQRRSRRRITDVSDVLQVDRREAGSSGLSLKRLIGTDGDEMDRPAAGTISDALGHGGGTLGQEKVTVK